MVSDLKSRIVARAAALGFDACRVAAPDAVPEAAARLAAWLAAGRHGTMDWMADTAERRGSPAALWPEVRSVVMLGLNYGPEADPRDALRRRDAGAVSVYARHRDYHDVVKGKLKDLAGYIRAQGGVDARGAATQAKVFVDTAPVMEKPLAEAAGLGWAGKHTNLVSRDFGSWLFLGSVFTTLALDPDPAGTDACGSCRACLDACPTGAFPAPRELDARRCISYLTIEHRGTIRPRAAGADGQPHLRLRRLPRRLPLEQVRRGGAGREASGRATTSRRPPSTRWRGSTIPPSGPCSRGGRSSASGSTASCATC